ncbi:SbcC/MukB-like Walker B domain-containing protein, partial [Methanocalculus sp.]|uniref:ATP-binding protein n=1 Tax=Methanocalculus sp. TaxID=2004547 RepID=UPI00262CE90B
KELNSLTRRRSKIPEKNIQIRELILNNLGFEESELPFIGELLQIKPEEKKWEGAIEHVLHSFGLSILVAERDYREVSSFVDKTNLKGKIVYYKIPERLTYPKQKEPEKNSLIGKIDIKADSEFSKWISMELFDRFNFICCESIEQFQKETRAITLNGQIKGNRGRHEKDDGKSIHDQRYHILGWNNQEKISRIKQGIANLEKEIKDTDERKSKIEEKRKFLDTRKTYSHDLLKFKEYSEIDWKKSAQEIEKCKAEIDEIKKTSDILKTLKANLERISAEIKASTDENSELLKQVGETESRIRDYEQSLLECKKILSEQPLESAQDLMPIIFSILPDENFTIKNIDAGRDSARSALTQMFDENSKHEGIVSRAIITKMNNFNHEYPEDTFEMIAAIESILEYQKFYDKLKTEDLPRYEQRFKEQLNEGTINDIAMFKSHLEDNAKQIEKNIKTINESLREIDYSLGTYIELLSEKISDVEITDFKIQLKNCLEGTISGEKDVYSEEKFNQVKTILDRFNSGNTADINWTNKVTDVRNWFSFSAMEKYSVDGSDKEFYSDSSGKSGGQKEKLALTILASALAYQFGPAGDKPKSKSFRFVIIDEAFSRGSDESTRYGMDLFKKLDLQLLMITPLQKIHVIENYINCVHLVSNETGNNSMIRDISIQEYHEMKNKQVAISN